MGNKSIEVVVKCRKRARWYQERLNDLINFLCGKAHLKMKDKLQAQAMLRELKERFSQDNRIHNSVRRSSGLSQEEYELHRTIFEASTELRAHTNSHPVSSCWIDQLYASRLDVDHYLSGLVSREEKAKDTGE
jgi:hypothetical protein